LNPIAQKSPSAVLAQMFEPIREDLEKVEREFVRHLESQVALIPTIGHYIQQGGGKRIRPAARPRGGTARSPGRTPAGRRPC